MTLRQRLLLTIAPLILLAALLGAAGVVALHQVSGQIDDILRDNYDSVVYMVALNDALQRIDAAFLDALLDRREAADQYRTAWKDYLKHLKDEQGNVTILPDERILVDQLTDLTEKYRAEGDRFFKGPPSGRARPLGRPLWPRVPGLRQRFHQVKKVADDIRDLNQHQMQIESRQAQATAAAARLWLGVGLAAAGLLAGLLSWWTLRGILGPIRDLTHSVQAIGAGNLNQTVPVPSRDELGQLAQAFNRMAAQLRDLRQAHSSRLLRAQRTSQATIDSFPDPVLVLDPDGRVELANPAARQLFGIAPPSVWNAPPDQTAPAEPWQPPAALRQPLDDALLRQRPYLPQAFDQTVSFRLGGEDRAYLPQVLPIQDPYGNTLGAAVVLNDVTRFRLMDQIKTDLVATVSHELKTPLTSVRLALHLLLEEAVGPLTPKQTELLLDARDNAERLLNMIEHLLALARLEQGSDALSLEPTAPQELLRVAADAARPRAESRHVDLVLEDADSLPQVAADPTRLGHALNNLLDNALTYTPEGGRVTLCARMVDSEEVELSVTDTGVGIPATYLPHVFDKFFRVPESQGHGTGLGLAIVREIATGHGGRVRCESTPGKGSVFTVTLPVWKGQKPQDEVRATGDPSVA